MGDKYKINGDRKMPRVGQEDQLSGYRVWPRANGFTGRAQNSPPAFTPQGQRASDKALTLSGKFLPEEFDKTSAEASRLTGKATRRVLR